MPVEIKFKIDPKFVSKFSRLGERGRDALEEVVKTAGFMIQGEVKNLMRNTPRAIRKDKKGVGFHHASLPGRPPAVDTGNLINSIFSQNQGPLSVIVGTDTKYGGFLEAGTSKMAARPFLQTALDNKRDAINSLIEEMFENIFSERAAV